MLNFYKLKYLVKNFLPPWIINLLIFYFGIFKSYKYNIRIKKHDRYVEISNKNKLIRISLIHINYLLDIINSFNYYFEAVKPIKIETKYLVDYSTPRYHEVNGFNLHPIIFPSFAESLSTTNQYLKTGQLKNGYIVFDLGAYSGLTSIIFDQKVGAKGQVIAVDADEVNNQYIKKNLYLYEKITGKKIELLEGAVWKDNKGLIFSNEGNMGSSAVSIIGKGRGKVSKIKSFTLSDIANKYNLKKVDFIKCDIEGAEAEIFKDIKFFKKYRPRVIIELHNVKGKSTYQDCFDQLSILNYKFKDIRQHDVSLPLLECLPK